MSFISFFFNFHLYFVGLLVIVPHLQSDRQWKINGLTSNSANKEIFEKDGEKISVASYFKHTHGELK
jgi:hypothetical protein